MIRLCSAFTVSPTLTSSSMTATASKSPMSGTNTSTGPALAAAATGAAATGAGAGAATGAGTAAAGAGAAAAAPATSSISTSEPSLTLSPSATFISLITPACELGISIEALSDSTVIRLCSALMVSPALTRTSMIVTSLKSPMSGTFTSISAMVSVSVFRADQAYSGLILSALMP